MAQISYRANLSAAIFPMTLARSGRSVIVPTIDQNFNRSIDAPDDSNRDAGIPQIIYGENILPTADGYQSVGYKNGGTLGTPGGALTSWQPLGVNCPLTGAKQTLIEIGFNQARFTLDGVTWLTCGVVGTAPTRANTLSTATVRGECYVQLDDRLYRLSFAVGILIFNEITATVLPVGFFTGVTNICGGYNYLIAMKYDSGTGESTVYWSSTTTPTDWTPSLVSGAGSGAISDAVGAGRFLRQHPTGFYTYCEGNVVNATYTGNARYPWRFIPVASSEGVQLRERISGDQIAASQIMLSNSGSIFQLTGNNCELIAPEVSELINRISYADNFDYTTNVFSVVAAQAPAKITYLMDRFIILSFNESAVSGVYYEAVVFDLAFKRYGKFNVRHNTVIDLTGTSNRRAIVFVDEYNNTTQILVQDVNDPTVTMRGVIVLGKFQYVRARFLCMDEISIETSQLAEFVTPANFQAYAIPTLDGKTFLPAQQLYTVAADTTGAVQTYYSSAEGRNVSLLFKGAFDLCSVDITFHTGGGN